MREEDLNPVVDASLVKPERVIRWEVIKEFPDLAKQLACRKGDGAKVQLGYEIVGKKKTIKYLLSIIRPIGGELHHVTEVYAEKKWKGRATAMAFMEGAYKHFKEMEDQHVAKRNRVYH